MFRRFLLTILTISEIVVVSNCDIYVCKTPEENDFSTDDKQLRNKLICNDKKMNKDVNITLEIELGEFSLSSFFPTKIMASNILKISWIDEQLTWNPDDYESRKKILMSTDDIWKPNLVPQLSEFGSGLPSLMESIDCKVSSIGNVTCTIDFKHSGYCQNDVTHWPYDIHSCMLQYMSVVYDIKAIFQPYVDINKILLRSNHPNWKILNVTVQTDRFLESNIHVNNIDLKIETQRYASEFVTRYCFLLFALIAMTLMTFWIPLHEGGRLFLTLINTVSHFNEIRYIRNDLPTFGESVPYIVGLYRDSLILSTISLIETITLKKIVFTDDINPKWIMNINKLINNKMIKQILFIRLSSKDSINENQNAAENDLKFLNQSNQTIKIEAAQIIDRIFFVIFFFVYFVLVHIVMCHFY